MSAEQNETIARRYFNAFLNNDADDATEYIAADARFSSPGFFENGEYGFAPLYTGAEAFQATVQAVHAAMPDFGGEIKEVVATKDGALVRYVLHGTLRGEFAGVQPTGKRAESAGMDLLQFSDGKISRVMTVWDEMRLWQQLGVLPPLPTD